MNGGEARRVAAVIGAPIAHSLSPAIHNAAFSATGLDAVLVAFHVEPAALGAAVRGMRALGFMGASVTVPHKQAVARHCDRIEPAAEQVGAINCLCFGADGDIVGHNTDVDGFADSLREDLGVSARGCRAVLLGAGGAARAVFAGLRRDGAESISLVARSPNRVDWAAGEAHPWTGSALDELLASCDLLVDCTSVGLDPTDEPNLPAPIPLERLSGAAAVVSLVYHREPALLADARARGLATLDGKGMLVRQGARAFELWTGQSAPIAAMRDALSDQFS